MGQRRIEWQRCPVCKRWGVMEIPPEPFRVAIECDNETLSCDSGTTENVDVTYFEGVEGKDWDYTHTKKLLQGSCGSYFVFD